MKLSPKNQAARLLALFLIGAAASSSLMAESLRIVSLRDLDADVPAERLDRFTQLINVGLHSQQSRPSIQLAGGSRAYLAAPQDEDLNRWSFPIGDLLVALELPNDQPVKGTLILPDHDPSAQKTFPFSFDPSAHEPAEREAFDTIRRDHYAHLANAGYPGTAWFRHRAGKAHGNPENSRRQNIDSTFALFTGSRAIAENLALDRELLLGNQQNDKPVDLDSIKGVTVRAIDWSGLLEPTETAIDPLAHFIPHDQHAIMIPSLPQLFGLLDTVESKGIPLLQSMDARNPYRGLATRYRRQMGLDVADAIAAKLPVNRVAITGGDPFFPSGTDVAVLLETDKPDALFQTLKTTLALKAKLRGAKALDDATAWESPDRSFSAHLAKLDSAVVIANSAGQINRIQSVISKKSPSLASLDEYQFFRQRYPLSEPENAYLFLSDPTIRRWSSPRVRIAASRRTRALAALSELTARHLEGEKLTGDFKNLLGKTRVQDSVVHSENFLTIPFVKPVSEMSFNTVTQTEADAYERWRTGYERGWGQAFDPIALRLRLDDSQRAMDLSVIPLTIASEYREWIEITGSKAPEKGALAAHPEARAFFSMAIDPEHSRIRELGAQSSELLPTLKAEPLAWIGDSVSVFIDDGFFWKAAEVSPIENIIMKNAPHIPVGIRIDSRSQMRLALFVSAVRAQIEKSAPGLLVWEQREHGDQPYLVIKQAEDDGMGEFDDIKIFYAAMKSALIISLDEAVLKRAIDREGKQKPTGRHLNLALDDLPPSILEGVFNNQADRRQLVSWSAIPILNEWHRFSEKAQANPAAWHASQFHEQIHCPGNRGYRWNPQHHTMESVAFGHPGNPRDEPADRKKPNPFSSFQANLTFEHDGLRLRARMQPTDRKKAEENAQKALEAANAAIEIPDGFPQAADLIPTAVGTTLSYRDEDTYMGETSSGTRTSTIISNKVQDDQIQVKIRTKRTWSDGDKEETEKSHETYLLSNGLHSIKWENEKGTQVFTTPMPHLPAKLAPNIQFGTVYQSEFTDESSKKIVGINRYNGVVKGLETVSVPAGTFEDCVRIDGEFDYFIEGEMAHSKETIWYAKGIGAVKASWKNIRSHGSYELTEFKPAPAEK